eukprot:TRINITY_DN3193_c0_g1_i2.p1 TRINITY_DN3193_c0_g1~~TRINITY_DN3193_c0_g1_i2.p1  ORF type:complete len:369 (-),score=72.51 TRINITY_DN3193_c0_g1_i2:172-1278(-)
MIYMHTYIQFLVSSKFNRRILTQAQAQQAEDSDYEGQTVDVPAIAKVLGSDSDSSDEESFRAAEDSLTEAEEKQIALFMQPDFQPSRTLGDIIAQKLQQKQMPSLPPRWMSPKISQVYGTVAQIMAKHRSGKLPKAFQIIPSLEKWEDVLQLTQPDAWSPAARCAATKLFASNLPSKMAQRFYYHVLLPAVLEDINVNKKLNFHLYLALKHAVFKPNAFIKAIMLPVCSDVTCTVRQAHIIASVMATCSIPFQTAGAALVKLSEMDYRGVGYVFMKVLLAKKYALSYSVIDALVVHFMRFLASSSTLPLIWHQCVLLFVQRYRNELTEQQNRGLRELLYRHKHPQISAEIHRELQNAVVRGQPTAMEM